MAQHPITEFRPQPGAWAHERRKQDHLAINRALYPLMQQMIDGDGAASALPAQVPRVRQIKVARLLEQGIEHLLIECEISDTGALATGQAMARQVAADHCIALLERPFDHMPVKAHVVVVAMQQKHCRHGLRRQPDLPHQLETRCLKPAQPALRRQVQAVEALIILRLNRQGLAFAQGREADAQAVGVKSGRHRVHPQRSEY
ncbi:hypothetical protein D3C81_1488430 [compost metagenome]